MATLEERFRVAADEVQNLSKRPSNQKLLTLYALYKQATNGDVEGDRPGFTNMVGRAKYDAWAERKGMDRQDAMQQYIDLVNELQEKQR